MITLEAFFYIAIGQNKASSLRPAYALTMSATEGASGVQISTSSFQTLSATVSEFASSDTLSNQSQWPTSGYDGQVLTGQFCMS